MSEIEELRAKLAAAKRRAEDAEAQGAALRAVLENARYPNRCIYPHVMGVESRDIGEWDDSNPLNRTSTMRDEFARIFGDGVGP